MSSSTSSVLLSAAILLSTMLTNSCSSSDLGKEKPDRVPVDLSLAGWESGAGAVISTKCANCHTSDRSPFVPSNTPRVLDGINKREFFANPDNIGLVIAMRKRIEAENTPQQMPPKFATPLNDDERIAVLNFLKSVEEQSLNATGNPDCKPQVTAKKLVTQNLLLRLGDDDDDDGDDDDDDDDQNPPVTPEPQPVPSNPNTPGTTTPNPCGQNGNGTGNGGQAGGENPGTNIPVPASFGEIQSIVVTTCAKSGCHTGNQGDKFALKTEDDFLRVKATALREIKTGGMPRGNASWRFTDDGKRVILWLSK
ncbi:MAG: c-type cytochrome [Proteobacteria bacterium]|nr:c-type cytochrome [Pseudomonadota bacterium]